MKDSDLWQTPDELYDYLNSMYNFKIDLCATENNSKSLCFADDIFKLTYKDLEGNAFMNPPFSNIGPYLEKAYELSKNFTIVCLVPSSIKTCKYLDFLDVSRGKKQVRTWIDGVEWEDLTRRTKFTHPNKKSSSPSFGCSLLIFNRWKSQ